MKQKERIRLSIEIGFQKELTVNSRELRSHPDIFTRDSGLSYSLSNVFLSPCVRSGSEVSHYVSTRRVLASEAYRRNKPYRCVCSLPTRIND